MRLSELDIATWAATLAVAAGLISYDATAIEELVVYGTEPPAAATPEDLRRDMDAYVRALQLEQKSRIDASLTRERTSKIQIAAARIPTRG